MVGRSDEAEVAINVAAGKLYDLLVDLTPDGNASPRKRDVQNCLEIIFDAAVHEAVAVMSQKGQNNGD